MTLSRALTFLKVICLTCLLVACESAEERAEGHYQNALALLAEGDEVRAIVELRNVFQLNGSHLEARHLIAKIHRDSGDLQDSYSQYLRLVEQYPDDLLARVALSEMAFQTTNWEELERHGAKAEELAPNDPSVEIITIVRNYRAAIIDENESDREMAANAASSRISSDPDNILLREVIIDNHLRNEELSDALRELDVATAAFPERQRYWQQRLQLLIRMGDEDGAESQLIDMVARFPDDLEQKATLIRYFLSRDKVDEAENFLRQLVTEAEQDDIGPRVDLIRFLLERRGVDAGIAELDDAIATESEPTPFILLKSGIDFTNGRQEEAIQSLELILETAEPDADNNTVKVTLARMLLETGNEVGARSLVETVLADEATQVEALKMNARWLIAADDPDGAIAGLRIALDNSPEDAEALTLMAEANSRKGSNSLARDFLALAVDASGNAPAETIRYARLLISEERYLPAEDILLDALRLAPSNVQLLTLTGDLYLSMEDYGRTNQVIETLRRVETPAAEEAAVGLELRRLESQAGTEEAIAFLESIANQEDATFGAQVALIRARLSTGDTESAVNLAETLLSENPDAPTAKLVMAMTASRIGDLDWAENLYRAVTAEFPNEDGVWLELSRLKLRQGERDAGRAVIDEALAFNPNSAQLLWAQASYFEQDGNFEGAIGIYETLYEADSNNIVVANNLASMLTTYRDDDESLDRAWNIARRFKDSTNPAVQDTYGWIAHRRGDSSEAVDYLQSAAAGLPNDAVVQFHYGEVLRALDQKEDAVAQYRKVLDIAGATDTRPQIAAARQHLTSLEAELASSD